MYFKRNIDSYLLEWKDNPRRKPLLLRGARQVGKSRSVRHLGESFENFVEINFETHPFYKNIFEKSQDVKEAIMRIGTLIGTQITPGKTLLFLDEIQSCPEALHSLWALKEDMPELHVIAAGSLLEFTLKQMPSFGVGRVRSMFMYPMSFEEFLEADGCHSWVEAMHKADYNNPLPEELHQALVQKFRSFLIVGGMPASVSAWVETHDYIQCAEELQDIQQTYYDDFAKYSNKIEPQLLRNTLRSVVMQIGSKFVFSRVDGGYRSEDVKSALTLLCDSGLIKMVQHSAGNGLPLGAEINTKFRKYNYLDTGLLLRVLDIELSSAQRLMELILAGSSEDLVNKGAITEMVTGWEIIKNGSPLTVGDLYYWENISKGATSEVDYLTSQDMQIIPIEVKAGVTGKMKSLRLFMSKKHIVKAKRCSLENFGMIEFLDEDDLQYRDTPKHIYIHPLYCLSTLLKL